MKKVRCKILYIVIVNMIKLKINKNFNVILLGFLHFYFLHILTISYNKKTQIGNSLQIKYQSRVSLL